MAGKVRGEIRWGFQPLAFLTGTSSDLAGAFPNFRANYLKSVNDPLRYQIQWFAQKSTGGWLTEGDEPSSSNYVTSTSEGDCVAVNFKVYTKSSEGMDWIEIGEIRKSRDIANKHYNTQQPANGHRFTIDISSLVADELSYSLCPINKGTWQVEKLLKHNYGGMNGGALMQDNVVGNSGAAGDIISLYNISQNGTMRRLRVEARFEIIDSTGAIVSATSTSARVSQTITVINSVNQFEKDSTYYATAYTMSMSSSTKYKFLSRCPNATENDSTLTYDFQKPIRVDEQAEFLQFYIRKAYSTNIRSGTSPSSPDTVGSIGIKVETFDASGAENTFYLRDFEDHLRTFVTGTTNIYKLPENYQNNMFVQNISPYYMNNTSNLIGETKAAPSTSGGFPNWTTYSGTKITDDTIYYRVSVWRFAQWSPYNGKRTSEYRYFVIDREDAKTPYAFVRLHWLNSLGGIDSYTAKRDVVEGLTISRDVVERKSSDRTWYQNQAAQTSSYISDQMRGGNIYKGGREVTNVNAEKNQSVYTEPLNSSKAKWLQEIMLSPNVWIEMDTDATAVGNSINPHLRPSTKEYIPIIITNNDVETVNQAEGLVKFNIEYTLSHKVITQRN
tara:strand:+ start:400 stop:2241 length:1842 start_codon:yes stop_codon:yes gene_type:complete